MLNFQHASPSDAKCISLLIHSFSDSFLDPERLQDQEQFFLLTSEFAEREYISSPRYIYLNATINRKLIASAAIRDNHHLFHLFVSKQHQRIGVGTNLWHRIRNLAIENGNKGVFTVNSAPNSVPFYQRLGFVETSLLIRQHGVCFVPMRYSYNP